MNGLGWALIALLVIAWVGHAIWETLHEADWQPVEPETVDSEGDDGLDHYDPLEED